MLLSFHRNSLCGESNLSSLASELPILLRRQMDVLAPPASRPDATLELGERIAFGLTPPHEAAEAVQRGEVVAAGQGTDESVARLPAGRDRRHRLSLFKFTGGAKRQCDQSVTNGGR